METLLACDAPFVDRIGATQITGPAVVVDVLRAFTTAAYAIGSGAAVIYVTDSVDEALALKAANPGSIAMGEDRGRRPAGFDLANSPTQAAAADLDGRTVIQRTSAGTRGIVAAHRASPVWAASLVVASATARAIAATTDDAPTYVITGDLPDRPDRKGTDDALTAALIERARTGRELRATETAAALGETDEAALTLALGPPDCEPGDIEAAAAVDAFDFAMVVGRDDRGLYLRPFTV